MRSFSRLRKILKLIVQFLVTISHYLLFSITVAVRRKLGKKVDKKEKRLPIRLKERRVHRTSLVLRHLMVFLR